MRCAQAGAVTAIVSPQTSTGCKGGITTESPNLFPVDVAMRRWADAVRF